MKKIIRLFLSYFAILLLFACGKITVKGADGTEYESYQECCAAQDYQAAHQFLVKLQNDEEGRKLLEEAKQYVFKHEALYLMSQDNDDAKKRIIYLLKEEGDNNSHISMLIDLAIDNDDETFVKTLVNQFSGDASHECLQNIYQYFSKKGISENKDYLIGVFKNNNDKDMILEIAFDTDDNQLIQEYASNIYLSDNEIIKKLALKKNNSLSNIVLALLSKKQAYLSDRPSLGVTSYYFAADKRKFIDECENYESSIQNYNQVCHQIMEIGIECKNLYLSRGAINRMKSNITHKEIETKNDYYRIIVSTGDKSDITAANKALNDAINRRVFR